MNARKVIYKMEFMIEKIGHIKRLFTPGCFALVFLLILVGKGHALEKIFTVGVLNDVPDYMDNCVFLDIDCL